MTEHEFRAARLLGVLANVIRFRITLLLEGRRMTPAALAKALNRSVPRISHHLAILRAADVVMFKVINGQHNYWLKEPGCTKLCREAIVLAKRMQTLPA